MHIPRQDPGEHRNQTLQIVGLVGGLFGVYNVAVTALGMAWQRMPGLGYASGLGLIFFGAWRFARGSRGQRR
jgi:hypothetical protein